MLTVEAFPKRRALSTEASFEKTVAAEWKRIGQWSRHMSDHLAGIPDRYLPGGRWVEFKSLAEKQRDAWNWDGMSPEQTRACDELEKAGDVVMYCGLFQNKDGGRFVRVARYSRLSFHFEEVKFFDWPADKVKVARACLS